MNKIFKYFLLSMFLFFLFIIPVKADSDCAAISNKIENYKTYEEKIKSLDCNSNKDEQTVIQCNNIKLQQNMIISELMKLKDEKQICKSKTSEVNQIIKDNEDRCGKVFDDDFSDLINTIFTIFYIIGPILLIVFGSLDYAKATVSGDEKSLKKAHKTFFKRMLATVLLFISPIIVNFIINLSGSGYMLSGNAYVCDYEFSLYTKEWDIKYTAKQRKTTATTNTSSNTITSEGGQAIADAAKEIKEYIKNNGYHYGFQWEDADKLATPQQSKKVFCCATLVRASLYRSGTYTLDELKFLENTESAGGATERLIDHGWKVIWNANELEPGDVLVYDKPGSNYHKTIIEGNVYRVGHVEIYYGNGKKINTGDGSTGGSGFANCPVIGNFSSAPGTSSSQGFLCGLRYPGY